MGRGVGRRTGRRDRERARRVGDRHGVDDDHRRGADHALLAQPTCRPAQLILLGDSQDTERSHLKVVDQHRFAAFGTFAEQFDAADKPAKAADRRDELLFAGTATMRAAGFAPALPATA
jgi:hypothetical protein